MGSSRSAPLLMPSAQLSCFDTTTGWWAECLGVGFVVGRRLIEGGAVPCLSPVVTDFPEISRKFEGLRLELVSRNFALVQQKDGPGPTRRIPPNTLATHGVPTRHGSQAGSRPPHQYIPSVQSSHGKTASLPEVLPQYIHLGLLSGQGGFVIEFGGVCYQDTYPDVS